MRMHAVLSKKHKEMTTNSETESTALTSVTCTWCVFSRASPIYSGSSKSAWVCVIMCSTKSYAQSNIAYKEAHNITRCSQLSSDQWQHGHWLSSGCSDQDAANIRCTLTQQSIQRRHCAPWKHLPRIIRHFRRPTNIDNTVCVAGRLMLRIIDKLL